MQFRDYMIQEAGLLKSILFGIKSGVQKFKEKPPEKKVSEKKQILNQLMAAKDDKELSSVVEKMIQSGLRLTADGELKKPNKNWLLENVHAQKRHRVSKNRARRFTAPT